MGDDGSVVAPARSASAHRVTEVAHVAVDVWLRRPSDVPDGTGILDEHERRTLAGLVSLRAAEAYAAAHALARRAVADVAGCAVSEVRFERTCSTCGAQHGRPTLPDLPGISVSLTRRDGLVGVAVADGIPLGVDVESVGSTGFAGFPDMALHELERPQEVDGPQLVQRATAWTRKEAALKALGIGLRVDPSQVRAPADGVPTDVDGHGAWVTAADVVVPWAGHCAAVAVAGRARTVVVRMR